MNQKEFKQTCKATIPNGYFKKVNPHFIEFMCSHGSINDWYLAVYENGKASTCGCLPWAWKPGNTGLALATANREQFALNLKEVIPPKEDK